MCTPLVPHCSHLLIIQAIQLHEQCWKACTKHPDLEKYHQLLHGTNFKLVSKDESCWDNSKCVITNMPWQNPQIIEFLWALDTVHVSMRFRNSKPTRGNWPHCHLHPTCLDLKMDQVPRLPSDFYNMAWLESRSKFELAQLDVQPAIELVLSDQVKQ